ncbi:MAG TPA: Tad domain-containing protein [Tepidisphaeraceae bacterium]|nr:Tad domain-containing protein [Tepidisphaeraceae bacterium]
MTLVYATVVLSIMVLMASYCVDMGRIQLAKTSLQNAADSAARYAVTGMVSSSTQTNTAQQQAQAAVNDWKVDGGSLTSSNLTTNIGVWNSSTKVFTVTTTNPNAVKIDLVYTFTNSNGHAPLFLSAMSSQQPTLHASAIALASSQQSSVSPPAGGNLWLAGMPSGTQSQNFRSDDSTVWDYAGTTATPRQSPLQLTLTSLGVAPGDQLSFEGLSGTATYVPGSTANSADGDSTFMVALGQTYPPTVPTNGMNGMSNVRAPIGAIMAVFLDDNNPSYTSAPTDLDFSTQTQRDYSSISPKLKQVFFVGDGKKSDGEVQNIVVPTGATRVFVGMMDAWQWNDNVGNFQFKIYGNKVIQTVK